MACRTQSSSHMPLDEMFYSSRVVVAPSPTSNWVYGAFLSDRGDGKSRAVALTLMSADLDCLAKVCTQ